MIVVSHVATNARQHDVLQHANWLENYGEIQLNLDRRITLNAKTPPAAEQAFRTQVTRHWFKALRRRSQRKRLNWARMSRLATRWLPPARSRHPYPVERFNATTRGRSPVR
jgi:hypothetical protein